MKIVRYKNRKIKRLCESRKYAQKHLDKIVAERLAAAIEFIKSAESLNDMANMTNFRLHNLTGNREGQYAIDLGKKLGYRLVFKPEPPLSAQFNHFDFHGKCSLIKSIIILEVSNHYE